MKTKQYIYFDAPRDVLGSLRHGLRCRKLIQEDDLSWKWLILSLHSALQGACVCHLTTSAEPIGALNKKSTTEWLQYLRSEFAEKDVLPVTKIMPFIELLKKVRKLGTVGGGYAGQQITISDHDLSYLDHFHENFRNQLTHFEPTGWQIEISGTQRFIQIVCATIHQIHDYGWAFRNLNEIEHQELRNLLKELEV